MYLRGLGGCGKTIQTIALVKILKENGLEVAVTREHTRDTQIGGLIERIIKKIDVDEEVDPTALQMMFVADRINHTRRYILPLMEDVGSKGGGVVICDRYRDSTTAYAPPSQREYYRDIQRSVTINPDMTILLDLDPQEAVRRINNRGDADIFDRVEKLSEVRRGYLWCRDNSEGNYAWIEARGSVEEVRRRVLKAVEEII